MKLLRPTQKLALTLIVLLSVFASVYSAQALALHKRQDAVPAADTYPLIDRVIWPDAGGFQVQENSPFSVGVRLKNSKPVTRTPVRFCIEIIELKQDGKNGKKHSYDFDIRSTDNPKTSKTVTFPGLRAGRYVIKVRQILDLFTESHVLVIKASSKNNLNFDQVGPIFVPVVDVGPSSADTEMEQGSFFFRRAAVQPEIILPVKTGEFFTVDVGLNPPPANSSMNPAQRDDGRYFAQITQIINADGTDIPPAMQTPHKFFLDWFSGNTAEDPPTTHPETFNVPHSPFPNSNYYLMRAYATNRGIRGETPKLVAGIKYRLEIGRPELDSSGNPRMNAQTHLPVIVKSMKFVLDVHD